MGFLQVLEHACPVQAGRPLMVEIQSYETNSLQEIVAQFKIYFSPKNSLPEDTVKLICMDSVKFYPSKFVRRVMGLTSSVFFNVKSVTNLTILQLVLYKNCSMTDCSAALKKQDTAGDRTLSQQCQECHHRSLLLFVVAVRAKAKPGGTNKIFVPPGKENPSAPGCYIIVIAKGLFAHSWSRS